MRNPANIAILSLAAVLASCGGDAPVRVLHVNSLRGQIEPTGKDGAFNGGFSLLSAAISERRAEAGSDPIYTVAVYNAFHGTPEAHFTEGRAVIDLMNDVGFDALIVGPREFYFGQPALERLAAAARFPFVAANIRRVDGAEIPYLEPFFWDAKRKVGLIGLPPRTVLSQNLARDVAGLAVIDELEATRAALAELRRLGARTVGLYAGGIAWGGPAGSPDATLAEALLDIDGIDQYWFGSASPDLPDGMTVVERPAGARVITAQSGSRYTNGLMIAETAMARSPEGSAFRSFAVNSASYRPDASLADRIYAIREAVADVMDAKVAESPAALGLESEAESTMGNLLTDIFRERAGTEVFLLNSGKIRSAFGAGAVTRKSVYDTLPFGGNIVVVDMSGAQILRVLNRSCTFVGNPKAGKGFLQVSGLSFSWDPSRPAMDQVVALSVRIGASRLDPERVYSVGTEAYAFGGGDGYVDFKEMGLAARHYDETSILAVLEAALSARGIASAALEGRIIRLAGAGD